jgi:hypothetical protein
VRSDGLEVSPAAPHGHRDIINDVIKATHQWQPLLRQRASMDTLRFALALEVEGMDPEQAFILAQEIYRLYAHSVLGGVYQSMDYGVFDTLRIKADLTRTKEEAMTNVLRAMNAEDADQEKYRDGEMKRIDAERRQQGSSSGNRNGHRGSGRFAGRPEGFKERCASAGPPARIGPTPQLCECRNADRYRAHTRRPPF